MPQPRYVFVGGLHRSGTSLLARMIGAHPQVAAIENAPVPENEGVYLQGAIPHTALHGRPAHFATDPAQHLVEGGRYDTLETRRRLEADWAPWFDASKPWRVEKSPVNLTRMRLYQQLFPLSHFIVILRHPAAVAGAMQKWTDRSREELVDHWLAAHRQLAGDLPYLHAVLVLRYEDLVTAPAACRAALAAFLSLPAPLPAAAPLRNGNTDYADAPPLSPEQARAAADWGYGAALDGPHRPFAHIAHPLRAVREAVAAELAPLGTGVGADAR